MREYADPAPDIVVLFDDGLTMGSHFKGREIVLGERFPGVTVFGLFLARTVRPQTRKRSTSITDSHSKRTGLTAG